MGARCWTSPNQDCTYYHKERPCLPLPFPCGGRLDGRLYGFLRIPQPGDVVWDVGAHAGLSAYHLAQMVGPSGKVYAFEPDAINYEFMVRNIETHQLANVMSGAGCAFGQQWDGDVLSTGWDDERRAERLHLVHVCGEER